MIGWTRKTVEEAVPEILMKEGGSLDQVLAGDQTHA